MLLEKKETTAQKSAMQISSSEAAAKKPSLSPICCTSSTTEARAAERAENTVQGPVNCFSRMVKGACVCCRKGCGGLLRVVTCGRCSCERLGGNYDGCNRRDGREVPGVMVSPRVRGIGGSSIKGLQACSGVSTTKDRDLITVIDYAARNMNVLVKVDEAGSINGALHVVAGRIRGDGISDDLSELAQRPIDDVFHSMVVQKPGSVCSCNWKERFMKLTVGGELRFFGSDKETVVKRYFQLQPTSTVVLADGAAPEKEKFLLTVATGEKSMLIGVSSQSEQSVLASRIQTVIELLKRKRSGQAGSSGMASAVKRNASKEAVAPQKATASKPSVPKPTVHAAGPVMKTASVNKMKQ